MFDAFYIAYQKRTIAEELSQRRNLQISAIMSNPNYDQKEVNKEQIITDIEESYKQAIYSIYGHKHEEEVDLYANPFFAAGMKGLPDDPDKSSTKEKPPEKIDYDLDQD